MPVNQLQDATFAGQEILKVLTDKPEHEEDMELENQVEAIPTSEANDALLAAQKSVKEQLLSPAIPPYIPPVVPNKDYSTEQYFTCKDCGDRFILESSLVRHLERRSVTILYGCRTCLQTVLFYNRCELLAHLRGHSEEANSAKTSESLNTAQGKATLASSISSNDHDYSAKNNDHDYSARNSVCSVDEDLEPDALSLSPLQKSKIALGPFVPIPMDAHGRIIRQKSNETRKSDVTVNQVTEGVNESSSAGQVKSVDNNHLQGRKEDTRQTQMSLNTGGQVSPFVVSTVAAVSKDRTIILKSKDNNQTKTASINPPVDLPEVPDESPIDMLGSVECKECGIVPKNGDMKEHFLGSNLPINTQLKCKTCGLILPSTCSLSAHIRVHTQRKPYVCPECTREFGLWASLSVHLLYTCFHMSKAVRYRCNQCKCLFPSSVSLEVHILTQHVKHVYKCNGCPIACFTVQALNDHKINAHGHSKVATHSYEQCQLCPDRLIPKSRLLFHVNEHSKEAPVRIYVYQCSNCSFFSQRKIDFATHKSTCSRTGKGTVAAVPPAFSPDKVLAAHKVVFPADNNQNNNCIKVFYGVSSNEMQRALLPKPAVKNVVKTVSSPQQDNKPLTKFIIGQKGQFYNIGKIASQLKVQGKIGNEIQKPIYDKKSNKSYIYTTDNRVDNNMDEVEITLPPTASDTGVVEKDPLDISDISSVSPHNASPSAVKSGNVFRLCSICKKELVLFPPAFSNSNFPAWCVNCSKSHPLLKKDNKLLIVPKEKMNNLINCNKTESKTPNEELELNSECETKEKTIPCKKNKSNSIALNGPINTKKPKTSPASKAENNKYRCHICKMLISMEWPMVQKHFAEKHPSFNLLVLSPRVNKLKLNCSGVKMPFIVKDNRIYPKKGDMEIVQEYVNSDESMREDNEEANKDYQYNSNRVKSEFDSTESIEDGSINEKSHYVKRERDTDYDSTPYKVKRKKKSSLKMPDRCERQGGIFSCGQIIPPLQQHSTDLIYTCSKCQYTDVNVQSFREHILKHRVNKNEFQCMECGMCFVVRPSFEKHLFVNHRIKDAEIYMKDNNCCDNSEKDDTTEGISESRESSPPPSDDSPPDLVENQCRVCREIFDSRFQLNKHIRIHGMAFLLMKKRETKVT